MRVETCFIQLHYLQLLCFTVLDFLASQHSKCILAEWQHQSNLQFDHFSSHDDSLYLSLSLSIYLSLSLSLSHTHTHTLALSVLLNHVQYVWKVSLHDECCGFYTLLLFYWMWDLPFCLFSVEFACGGTT